MAANQGHAMPDAVAAFEALCESFWSSGDATAQAVMEAVASLAAGGATGVIEVVVNASAATGSISAPVAALLPSLSPLLEAGEPAGALRLRLTDAAPQLGELVTAQARSRRAHHVRQQAARRAMLAQVVAEEGRLVGEVVASGDALPGQLTTASGGSGSGDAAAAASSATAAAAPAAAASSAVAAVSVVVTGADVDDGAELFRLARDAAAAAHSDAAPQPVSLLLGGVRVLMEQQLRWSHGQGGSAAAAHAGAGTVAVAGVRAGATATPLASDGASSVALRRRRVVWLFDADLAADAVATCASSAQGEALWRAFVRHVRAIGVDVCLAHRGGAAGVGPHHAEHVIALIVGSGTRDTTLLSALRAHPWPVPSHHHCAGPAAAPAGEPTSVHDVVLRLRGGDAAITVLHHGPLVTHNAYDAHPWSSMLVGEGSLALRGALAPSSAARSGALTAAVPGCVGATSLVRAEGALDASDDVRALVRGARRAGRGQRWWCAML